MQASNLTTNPTMFYDGSCPLCSREVRHYRKLDRANRVRWVDITRPHNAAVLAQAKVDFTAAMVRLHVLTRDGRLVTGVYAFATIWAELPYYRRLASGLTQLRLLPLLDQAYGIFARWRFRRRCRDGQCRVD